MRHHNNTPGTCYCVASWHLVVALIPAVCARGSESPGSVAGTAEGAGLRRGAWPLRPAAGRHRDMAV